MSKEFTAHTFTPIEMQEFATNISHRTVLFLYNKNYITKEQYDELLSSLVVTYVRNNSFIGKVRELLFGNSKLDNDISKMVISQLNPLDFER